MNALHNALVILAIFTSLSGFFAVLIAVHDHLESLARRHRE